MKGYSVRANTKLYKDILWTISALCLLNIVIQFVVYPFINLSVGSEEYGNLLFLISVINIIAIAIGASVNNRRMVASAFGKTSNAEYTIFLITVCLFLIPISLVVLYVLNIHMSILQFILFWILMCCTTLRYYADVEFRLQLNYKGYFVYYLLISIGYLLGILLFKNTHEWTLIFLPGEAAGVLFVIIRGSIFKKNPLEKTSQQQFLKAIFYLIFSQLLIQIVFNSDRLILKIFSGGAAVTIYYIASLAGKTIALLATPINSVIIGYLAKSNKAMTLKRWITIAVSCVLSGAFILSICVIGSHILIRFLYPKEYAEASSFFILANLAQIAYFLAGILATVLLRYVKEKYQLRINIVYVLTFLILVIPATLKWRIIGFSYAIVTVNILRFIYIFLIMANKIRRGQISNYKLS